MRIETIGDCTLYLGDCREILPTLGKIDVVMTDPVWPNVSEGLIPGWDRPFDLFAEVAALWETTRIVVHLRSDSDPRILASIGNRYPFIAAQWLRYAVPSYTGRVLGGNEIAYLFGKPIPSAPGQRVIPCMGPVVMPGDWRNGHPCPRNIKHTIWLVYWSSVPNEIICDPFMGSGTTGVACVDLNRKFIGIEIEPKYFDIACRRIADEIARPRLPLNEPTEQLDWIPKGRKQA